MDLEGSVTILRLHSTQDLAVGTEIMHWDTIGTRDLRIGSWYVAISTMAFVLKVVVEMTVMINKNLRASYVIPNTVSGS